MARLAVDHALLAVAVAGVCFALQTNVSFR
jgi:hypothetical protein